MQQLCLDGGTHYIKPVMIEVMNMLIAISGKQRAGKDTVANYLVDNYGFRRISFAQPIKTLAVSYFGLDPKDVYVNKPDYVRKVLQDIGKIGRYINEDFWVEQALRSYNPKDNIVISDLRFQNEARYLKSLDGILVRIESDYHDRLTRGPLTNEEDISEIDLDDYQFDYYLYNNSSLGELYMQVDILMEELRDKYGKI